MAKTKRFLGFPSGTLTFLRGLRKNNSKKWFDAHRADYEAYWVQPAKEFAVAAGEHLAKFAPDIVVEPRINGSIFRTNRDVRFAKDKRPYKDHLDFAFWEGEKKSSPSSFFFRVSPDGVFIGAGFHACPQMLKGFRAAVADEMAGKDLMKVAKKLRKAGYHIKGQHYKRHPRGYPEDGSAAEFMLHDSLYVVTEDKPQTATSPDILKLCTKHWKAAAPLHHWLMENL